MLVPCKGCAERSVGCHAKCEKYIAFRKERDRLLDKNLEERKKQWFCDEVSYKPKPRRFQK